MKAAPIFILLMGMMTNAFCQQTTFDSTIRASEDYIVLRKSSDIPLHTYFSGGFISATTLNGFNVNGIIKSIRNDSIYVIQQETRLNGTEFGSRIDTVFYTLGFDYREVDRYNFAAQYVTGYSPGARRGGFFRTVVPQLMKIGGIGYIVLELVNGTYRHESVNSNNKVPSLLIAGGIAAGGFLWTGLQRAHAKSPPKYKVYYIRARK